LERSGDYRQHLASVSIALEDRGVAPTRQTGLRLGTDAVGQLHRLKNLNMILWVVLAFLYSLKKEIVRLSAAFTRTVRAEGGLRLLLKGFVYYRIYEVAKTIFRDWRQYNTDPYGGRYQDRMQLRVNFT
jgi:hypothetical protein